MKHHKLRITWSVAWGVLAMLVVALWVQGFWLTHTIKMRRLPFGCSLWSGHGAMAFSFSNRIPAVDSKPFVYESYPVTRGSKALIGFDFQRGSPISWTIFVPDWFTLTLLAVVGTLPSLPWRFGLRTLLIATTLVAFGLGLIVLLL